MNARTIPSTAAALLILACTHPSAAAQGAAPPEPACAGGPVAGATGPRRVVLISDLHLGHGPKAGAWHAYEDFRWSADLDAFLGAIEALPGPTDLVVAGDMFELWQTDVTDDCPPADGSDRGCSAAAAKRRLERAMAAHDAELTRLRAFASRPGNRLVVIPGNHDVALLYPEVEAVLAARMAGAAYAFAAKGCWLSSDGRILVEHGHQVRRDPNWFTGWPTPFVGDATDRRIQRTGGEQFVRSLFNAYELQYPIVDNLTDDGTALKLILEKEGVVSGATKFLKHILLQSTRSQVVGWLGDDKGAPRWDLEAARARGTALWAEVLPPGDPGIALFAGPGKVLPADLTEEELREVCDGAEAYNRSQDTPGTKVRGCPRSGLGGDEGLGKLRNSLFRTRDADFAAYLQGRQAAVTPPGLAAFDFYVFGHTHAAESFQPLRGDPWSPTVLNDGAWQRIATPAELAALAEPGESGVSLLRRAPEKLPPAYDAIVAEPGGVPELRCWREMPGGWRLDSKRCHK